MPLLKLMLFRKKGKIRNSDPYHFSGIITQKSIQWFRLQINDSISMQSKHCIEMEKKLWLSQIHRSARASPYNP